MIANALQHCADHISFAVFNFICALKHLIVCGFYIIVNLGFSVEFPERIRYLTEFVGIADAVARAEEPAVFKRFS